MATLDPIKPTILATRILTRVQPDYAKRLGMPKEHRSLAILTCDIDDSLYAALDEATKAAQVEVVYAKSFYAGSGHASGPLSGEVIGMLSAPTPAEAEAGLRAAIDYAENEAWFYSADDQDGVAFFAHVVSRTGTYLSKEAGIPVGDPLAYLIAPPLSIIRPRPCPQGRRRRAEGMVCAPKRNQLCRRLVDGLPELLSSRSRGLPQCRC